MAKECYIDMLRIYAKARGSTKDVFPRQSCFPKATSPIGARWQSTTLWRPSNGMGMLKHVQRRCRTTPGRTLFTDCLPTWLVPPVLFTSLLIGLWTYKCIMTVIFQDKFIYMPYMPPFARHEKIEDYTSMCHPVKWEQQQIKASDGTRLALCVGKIEAAKQHPDYCTSSPQKLSRVIICYFQGNGSSSPPRLPLLSNVLKHIQKIHEGGFVQYEIFALSYRGYWKSSGRASQSGIEQDAQALLKHIEQLSQPEVDLKVVLWGQSIGAGIAATAAATYIASLQPEKHQRVISISALILETPFTSVKAMLLALYPQKWLPYQYLSPFLWNHWDSEAAIRRLGDCSTSLRPSVLLIAATRDEVVPPEEADKLEKLCRAQGLDVVRRNIIGALHTDATMRIEGQEHVGNFILSSTLVAQNVKAPRPP